MRSTNIHGIGGIKVFAPSDVEQMIPQIKHTKIIIKNPIKILNNLGSGNPRDEGLSVINNLYPTCGEKTFKLPGEDILGSINVNICNNEKEAHKQLLDKYKEKFFYKQGDSLDKTMQKQSNYGVERESVHQNTLAQITIESRKVNNTKNIINKFEEKIAQTKNLTEIALLQAQISLEQLKETNKNNQYLLMLIKLHVLK